MEPESQPAFASHMPIRRCSMNPRDLASLLPISLAEGDCKYIEPHKGPNVFRQVPIATGFQVRRWLCDLKSDIAEHRNPVGLVTPAWSAWPASLGTSEVPEVLPNFAAARPL